jgi:hypothetical protein
MGKFIPSSARMYSQILNKDEKSMLVFSIPRRRCEKDINNFYFYVEKPRISR